MLDRGTKEGLYRAVLAETDDVKYAEEVKSKRWLQEKQDRIAAERASKK